MRKTAANVEMQGIEFQIINDSDEASKGLEELSKSLGELKNSIGGSGTKLAEVAEGIQKTKEAVKGTVLSTFALNMSALTKSLKPLGEMKFTSVTSFLKQINAVSPENLEKIAAIDFSNLKEAADAARVVSGVSRISSATTGNSMPPLEDAGVTEMPAALMETKQGLQETREEAEKATSKTRSLNKAMKDGANDTKTHTSKLKDFLKSLKRIAKYRAVRSVISGITSSVKEGIQNLAQYSKALNGTDSSGLNTTLSQYAAKLLELKNAIGAAVAPMLQALLPAFNTVAELAVKAANAINQFFSAMNGQTTYTKAIYNAVDYADSLNGASEAAAKLKKSVMGFDELNILPDNSTFGTGDYGVVYEDMFKEEEIGSGMQEFGKWAKDNLQEITTMILGVWASIKAVKVASWATNVMKKLKALKILDKVKNLKTSLNGVQKGALVAVAAVAEFATIKTAVKDLASGCENVGTKIAEIGVAATTAGAVMYAVMGPAGIAVAAVTGLTAALVGVLEAQVDYHYELQKTAFYKNNGIAIDELRKKLTNYFNALDFDKQSEWVKKIENAQTAYDNAASSYDTMWGTIANKPSFDTSDIENLTNAITDLADAAKELNDARFASLMSSIKTSIELNITGELSDRLGNLVDKLEQAQMLLDTKITGLTSEYQQILTDISNNGGVATSAQKSKLSQLRSEITKFTLSNDASTARYEIELEDALKGAINAGSDKDTVIANIKDLMADRDTYLDSLKDKYASDMNTLEQLINLDKTEFGGALGFSTSDLETLKASYETQLAEVNNKYNAVLDKIKEQAEASIKIADFESKPQFGSNAVSSLWNAITNVPNLIASKETISDFEEIIELLEKYRINGYATGGFPTTGELFIAREAGAEMVGSIGGRTAIANNDQIVEAVSAGVYQAVVSAMGANNSAQSGGQMKVIATTVDGRVLFETLVGEARSDTLRTGYNRLVEV